MITESTPRAERRLDVSTGAQWAPMDGIAEGKENYEGPLGALLAGRGARCSRVAAIVEWIPPKREERVRIAAFRQQLNSTGVKFTGTSPKSHDRLKISPAHMRRLLAKSDSR